MHLNRWMFELAALVLIAIGFFVVQGDIRDENRHTIAILTEKIQEDSHAELVKRTEELRAGCESGNAGLRRPLYEFLGYAHERVDSAAKIHTGAERDTDIEAATNYAGLMDDMEIAVEDVAKKTGSPEIDCEERYSLPEPPDPPSDEEIDELTRLAADR